MQSFKTFIREASETKRIPLKSIRQLSTKDFLKLLNVLDRQFKGILSSKTIKVSEKIDGLALRFGLDEDNKFFIETSYSGPVRPGEYFQTISKKFGYTEPNDYTKAFDKLSKELDKFRSLQNFLKKYKSNNNSIKVIVELLYNPLGKHKDNLVRFVKINYDKKKLGNKATFILLGTEPSYLASDSDFIRDFKTLSTPEFKFSDSNISEFEVDLSTSLKDFYKALEKYPDWKSKIASRKKADKPDKEAIKDLILKLQDELENNINSALKSGKYGPEFEGLVLDLGSMKIKTQSAVFKARDFKRL